MQTAKSRVQRYRNKLRAAGLKPIQIWLPDPNAPGFAEECQRQSAIAAENPANLEDLEAFAEIADWGKE